MKNKEAIGIRLRIARQRKEMLQKRVAKILGINPGTLSNYEAGKREPDNETLIKLCNLYDVTIEYILNGTIQSNNKNSVLNLSEREKELLTLFNTLSKEGQDYLLQSGEMIKKLDK